MGLSEHLKKLLTFQKTKACEQGQAVIEYILILIMVVSIILGVLYQFNDVFKNFIHSYFGDYIACLLETGELPTLGGDGGPNQGVCNAQFKNFNVSSGRSILDPNTNRNAPEGSGRSSGDGNQSGGGGDSSSNQSPSQSKSPSLRSSRFNSSNSPSNGEAGALSDRPARQRLNINQSPDKSDSKEAGEASLGTGVRGGRRIIRRRVMRLGEEYFTEDEKKKKEKTNNSQKVKKGGEAVSHLRKARL